MVSAPCFRSAVFGVSLAILTATPAYAKTTVARVTLQIPAAAHRAAASTDITSYMVDAVAHLRLLRPASLGATASRFTVLLPPSAKKMALTTHGDASRFPSVAVRQRDAAGATLRRTVFSDVRVVRIDLVPSALGDGRRVTFSARRIAEAP